MILAKPWVFGSAFSALSLLTGAALAHVELDYPPPRAAGQSEGNLKNTPCGQNANGRTDRVTVFEPGQTITVTFNEFINHPSYYRVAFDPDGDNFPMRSGVPANATESIQTAEAAEQALFQGTGSQLLAVVPEVNGAASSATVTLPNMECENCTLQLIEFMYDKADPQHGYYQCADIALRSAGTVVNPGNGEGNGEGDNGAGAPDAGAPSGGGNTGSAGSGSTPPAANGGSGSVTPGATPPAGVGGGTA
ncbi:MAG TPA: SCE4755 family polysaccharide monooxygenase-like protein, partial [Polyangiaceae bacterium]|nr:SCE4755 family polysaccharide monooxygenase-like protein [Polyangiaceae bacterium]